MSSEENVEKSILFAKSSVLYIGESKIWTIAGLSSNGNAPPPSKISIKSIIIINFTNVPFNPR